MSKNRSALAKSADGESNPSKRITNCATPSKFSSKLTETKLIAYKRVGFSVETGEVGKENSKDAISITLNSSFSTDKPKSIDRPRMQIIHEQVVSIYFIDPILLNSVS
jgi:hypothetical protein